MKKDLEHAKLCQQSGIYWLCGRTLLLFTQFEKIERTVVKMMTKCRMVSTDFWRNSIVLEKMTPEDKYFYLYLLTNELTTDIGIYRISKRQMAFDLDFSIDSVHVLMDRFIEHYKLIRYNPTTGELAIKNWWKDIMFEGGRQTKNDIFSELIDVEDLSLILYVSESMTHQDLHSLFESFDKHD